MPTIEEIDIQEKLGRAYLYWTPHETLALGLEYQFEDIDNDGVAFTEAVTKVKTHRIGGQLRYFHGLGFSAGIGAKYVDQEGEFQDLVTGLVAPGEDSFLVVDASIAYRLPKRWGTLSLTVNNVLDEEFRFQDTDPENPQIIPERLIRLNFTLAFGS